MMCRTIRRLSRVQGRKCNVLVISSTSGDTLRHLILMIYSIDIHIYTYVTYFQHTSTRMYIYKHVHTYHHHINNTLTVCWFASIEKSDDLSPSIGRQVGRWGSRHLPRLLLSAYLMRPPATSPSSLNTIIIVTTPSQLLIFHSTTLSVSYLSLHTILVPSLFTSPQLPSLLLSDSVWCRLVWHTQNSKVRQSQQVSSAVCLCNCVCQSICRSVSSFVNLSITVIESSCPLIILPFFIRSPIWNFW